jgi:hypothetical protein
MKRLVTAATVVLAAVLATSGTAQAQGSTFTVRVVRCDQQFPGDPTYYAEIMGAITPVPSTDYDISVVTTARGEINHLSLPGGFDITGAALIAPLPLGVVTFTAFHDLNNNNVQDSGEPTIASTGLDFPCEPQTAEECKNGGWRTFPFLGFKNQGDCVSLIRHRAR